MSIFDGLIKLTENISQAFSGYGGRVAAPKQVSPSTIISPTTQVSSITGPTTTQSVPTLATPSGYQEPSGNPKEAPYGRTGTTYYGGWIAEDDKHDLEGRDGILMFDKMYKSDYQVYTAIERGNSKIKQANWYIEPPDEKNPQDVEESTIIAKYLFEKNPESGINKSWLEALTEILTFRYLGLSIFEPLWREVTDEEHGRLWVWSTLGWRSAKSLWQAFFANDKLYSIRQISYGDDYNYIDIPGNEVLVFTYNKTGNNIYGPPPTRRMYGPWIRKNNSLQVNAMGIENSARGVIDVSIPEDKILSPETSEYKASVNSFAQGVQPAIFHPGGKDWELKVVDLKYDASNVHETIRMEDAAISKTTENEQAEMGLTEVGSKGMHGSKQAESDASVKVDARYICEIMQTTIDDFVKFNFPPRRRKGKYKLNFTGIDSKAGLEEAQKDGLLVTAGFLDPTNKLHRAYINKKYDIPGGDEIEDGDVNGDGPETPQDEGDKGPAEKDKGSELATEESEHGDLIKQIISDAKAGKERPVEDYAKEIVAAHHKKNLKEFNPKRKLTEYELKVNFSEIDASFTNLNDLYETQILKSFNDFIIPQYKKALYAALVNARNRHAAALTIELSKKGKVKEIITDIITRAVEGGYGSAKSEVKNKKKAAKQLTDKPLPPGIYGWIKAQADLATSALYSELKKKADIAAVSAIDNGLANDAVIFEAGEILTDYLGDLKNIASGIVVNKAYNEGRDAGFNQYADEIQGYQYSAILDDVTCPLCEALDGQTYKEDDPNLGEEPPLHNFCRCIIVPILKGEESPNWTGLVPKDTENTPEGGWTEENINKYSKLCEGLHTGGHKCLE
jgi:SPP1 gp7 family putative phage head morphogenesis protein